MKVTLSRNGQAILITKNNSLKVHVKSLDSNGKFSSDSYENLVCSIDDVLQFDYKAPKQLETVELEVFCSYTSRKDGRVLTLSSSSKKKFNDFSNSTFTDLYLRQSIDGYNLHILGKNGESKVLYLVSLIKMYF